MSQKRAKKARNRSSLTRMRRFWVRHRSSRRRRWPGRSSEPQETRAISPRASRMVPRRVVQGREVGQHPRQPGQQQHAHRPGQDVAPVGQPAKDGQGQGQRGQAHDAEQHQPGQGGPAIGQAVPVKERGPGAALLLHLPLRLGEHQVVLLLLVALLLLRAGHAATRARPGG